MAVVRHPTFNPEITSSSSASYTSPIHLLRLFFMNTPPTSCLVRLRRLSHG